MKKSINPYAFPGDDWEPGMTLLDYFAGQAIAGLLASDIPFGGSIEKEMVAGISRRCYIFAHAMLAERQKQDNQ